MNSKNNHPYLKKKEAAEQVRHWLQTVVIGLNLCPFASVPFKQDKIRYVECSESSEALILQTLIDECQFLEGNSSIETSLLVLTKALDDFFSYNQFLGLCDDVIESYGWEGQFQIASFHPDYFFADVPTDCVSNWTNRAPFPVLHILREVSLDKALDNYPDADSIPDRNIEKMRSLSIEDQRKLFPYLFSSSDSVPT